MKTQEELIVEGYLSGSTNTELSLKYGLHRMKIQRILKRNNIKLKKRKTSVKSNIKFFSEYNEESCYWAGFILADGYIRKNRNTLHIKLNHGDIDHLYLFLKSIKCNKSSLIKKYKNYVSIDIHLDEYKNDLSNNFDIKPNKTYNATITNKIPFKYYRHFIRGYFDGDGCISVTTTRSISFVGTVEVLGFIKNFFYENLNVNLKSRNITPPICNLKNNIGTISYSGMNSKKIVDWLYSDSKLYLKRKYDKYLELYKNE